MLPLLFIVAKYEEIIVPTDEFVCSGHSISEYLITVCHTAGCERLTEQMITTFKQEHSKCLMEVSSSNAVTSPVRRRIPKREAEYYHCCGIVLHKELGGNGYVTVCVSLFRC